MESRESRENHSAAGHDIFHFSSLSEPSLPDMSNSSASFYGKRRATAAETPKEFRAWRQNRSTSLSNRTSTANSSQTQQSKKRSAAKPSRAKSSKSESHFNMVCTTIVVPCKETDKSKRFFGHAQRVTVTTFGGRELTRIVHDNNTSTRQKRNISPLATKLVESKRPRSNSSAKVARGRHQVSSNRTVKFNGETVVDPLTSTAASFSSVPLPDVTLSPIHLSATTLSSTQPPSEADIENGGSDMDIWPPSAAVAALPQPAKVARPPLTPINGSNRRLASLRLASAQARRARDGKRQTMIDAGQRDIGPVTCDQCGMMYQANDPDDVALHQKTHNQLVNGPIIKHQFWKKQKVLKEFNDGRIVVVTSEDPMHAQQLVGKVLGDVCRSFGFGGQTVGNKLESKTYIFVSNGNCIVGVAVVEPIKEAYKLIAQERDGDDDGHVLCCEDTAVPVRCGINLIWTSPRNRRRGIASRLLDCVRHTFIFGKELSKDEVAISDPTADGRRLGTGYFGTSTFLVYG